MTLTISAIASILVIGALIASPDAYSSKDKNVLDECKCEKPDTLKVFLTVPDGEKETDFRVEFFKKLDDRDNPDKRLFFTPVFQGDEDLTISATSFAKDKLESNTAFVVYKIDGLPDLTDGAPAGARVDELVALMQIHTSCSKPLFKDMIVDDSEFTNNGYSLKVIDGLVGGTMGTSSIPIADSLTCEDKKSKSTGTITVKKALTNDNGGTAKFEDFTITVTNVETPETPFTIEIDPLLGMGVKDVPAGTYTLNEILPDPSKGIYTTVLIAGDTGCPSMVDEEFIIKKGKDLSCIIYNDDNFNGDGTLDGDGIFFVRNSISLETGTCEDDEGDPVIDSGLEIFNSPCIVVDGTALFIADPTLDNPVKKKTAIIISTIIQIPPVDPPDEFVLSPPECVFEGVSEMFGVVGFGMECPGIQTDGSTYNANYAIIDASP